MTMMTRRAVAGGLCLCLAGIAKAENTADALESEINSWVKDPENAFYFEDVVDDNPQKGSLILAPSDERVKWAASFLAKMPVNLAPFDLARKMMQEIPADRKMEWPPDTPTERKPANPLIVAFFAATKTKPQKGDETAWCAAFMCWVLKQSGFPHPGNAGSYSFRNFQPLTATADPSQGDLVLFKNKKDPGFGHVAFFDGFVDAGKSRVWCLGGNQGNRISRAPFDLDGSTLRLHSFRKVSK